MYSLALEWIPNMQFKEDLKQDGMDNSLSNNILVEVFTPRSRVFAGGCYVAEVFCGWKWCFKVKLEFFYVIPNVCVRVPLISVGGVERAALTPFPRVVISRVWVWM